MITRFLVVDGCHATGSSSHAEFLAAGLRSHRIDARAYHHPKHPAGCDGVARVAWYMGARAEMIAREVALMAALSSAGDDALRVIVLDRGPWSGVVYARSQFVEPSPAVDLAMREAASEPWRSSPLLVLGADDAVLDARLAARGEDPAESYAERCEWARIDARRVDTGRDADAVRAELLAWALREVGR